METLPLWREACRHIELPESAPRLARLLGRRLPADLLLVRRLLPEDEVVETVAVARVGRGAVPSQAHTPCAGEAATVAAWCASGTVGRMAPGERGGPVGPLAPEDLDGHTLVGGLKTEGGDVGALVLARRTPFSDDEAADLADALEPFAVALGNHLRVQELRRLREAAEAEKRALLVRLARRDLVEEVIGVEGSLRAVMTRVEQVAPTTAPVLLLGETGTGKEVVARTIHTRSSRREGPVVRVNCGAIPAELVDSELFGHERGAFTGAVQTRRGWFERADGGTLFLDEVGELPLPAQVRLLRVLQDGSYERVGGDATRTADVRVIAATHRDLEALVREGRFREDLYYRLSVFPIYLPPLRSRHEDLRPLADHFAYNAGLRLGSAPLAVSDADLRLLEAYAWPGNVRELAAVIERAAILGSGLRLDLAGAMGTRLYAQAERLAAPLPLTASAAPEPLAEAMRRHVERALGQTGGRVEGSRGAAALLGLNASTLRARMRKLGVDPRAFRAA